MSTVLLLILLIVSIILTGLILIQRSEGGALGIGGGGGGGGFMSGRSATDSIQKMTGWLGAAFLVLSLALSVVMNKENQSEFLLDQAAAEDLLTNGSDSVEETAPLGAETDTPSEPVETSTETAPETGEEPQASETEETPEQPQR